MTGRDEFEEKRRSAILAYAAAEKPVVSELRQIGLDVDHVQDLLRRKPTESGWQAAVPVLLKWLPMATDESVRGTIARALGASGAGPVVTPALISEFCKPTNGKTLRDDIAVALSDVADDGSFGEVVQLIRNRQYGWSRSALIIALGKMSDSRVDDVLIECLEDPHLANQAVIALGKRRARDACPVIRMLLESSPDRAVRREARKALRKLGESLPEPPPPVHLIKGQRPPSGSAEWSMNIDLATLEDWLQILSRTVDSGFGTAEVAEVLGATDIGKAGQAMAFQFWVVAAGEPQDLWLTLSADRDGIAGVIQVSGRPVLVEKITQAMRLA